MMKGLANRLSKVSAAKEEQEGCRFNCRVWELSVEFAGSNTDVCIEVTYTIIAN